MRIWQKASMEQSNWSGLPLAVSASTKISLLVELKNYQMLFMLIERFKDDDMLPIYKRVRDEGRMFPEGLKYIDSWVEPNFSRCFQLMECDDLRLLQEWILKWRGSGATFEIIPVVSSKDTQEVVAPLLDHL
jgi:hypothetical protein